jgi:hypothetical protein
MAVKRVRVPGGWKKAAAKKAAMPIGFKGAKKPKKAAKEIPVPTVPRDTKPSWQPPPMENEALNPRAYMVSHGQLSPGMHAVLGGSPDAQSYRVKTTNPIYPVDDIAGDGHEITDQGYLIIRKGFLIVAMFNVGQWSSFRIAERPKD